MGVPPEPLEVWQVVSAQLGIARTERRWSVRELAERVHELGFDGPSSQRISQIEAGGRPGALESVRQRAENIRLRGVVALAAALGRHCQTSSRRSTTAAQVSASAGRDSGRASTATGSLDTTGKHLAAATPRTSACWTRLVRAGWRKHVEAQVGMPAWLGLVRRDQAERRAIVSGGTAVAEGVFSEGGRP